MMKDVYDEITGELLPVGHAYGEPFMRTAYNYDRDLVSIETGLRCDDPSLAQQHMANDSDINEIVRRFGLGHELPEGHRVPTFGDFSGIFDYRAALAAIREADDSFMELPADLRARFENNPQHYLEFASNPANQEEIYNLGLAERPRVAPTPSTDASTASTAPD